MLFFGVFDLIYKNTIHFQLLTLNFTIFSFPGTLSHAYHGHMAKWLTRRSAKPLFVGSILTVASSYNQEKMPDERSGVFLFVFY